MPCTSPCAVWSAAVLSYCLIVKASSPKQVVLVVSGEGGT